MRVDGQIHKDIEIIIGQLRIMEIGFGFSRYQLTFCSYKMCGIQLLNIVDDYD